MSTKCWRTTTNCRPASSCSPHLPYTLTPFLPILYIDLNRTSTPRPTACAMKVQQHFPLPATRRFGQNSPPALALSTFAFFCLTAKKIINHFGPLPHRARHISSAHQFKKNATNLKKAMCWQVLLLSNPLHFHASPRPYHSHQNYKLMIIIALVVCVLIAILVGMICALAPSKVQPHLPSPCLFCSPLHLITFQASSPYP